MTNPIPPPQNQQPLLLPFKQAAEVIGVPVWKLRRAAKAGLIPTYSLLNPRQLLNVQEVIRIMKQEV